MDFGKSAHIVLAEPSAPAIAAETHCRAEAHAPLITGGPAGASGAAGGAGVVVATGSFQLQ